MRLMIGQRISHYRILRQLGAGAMGAVYEAEDERVGQRVALKILQQRLTDQDVHYRLLRKVGPFQGAKHPNVCSVFDVGVHEGRLFIVMEKLEGQSLREMVQRGPLDVHRLFDIGVQLAQTLKALHDQHIFLGNIRPANIFITTTGQVKLLAPDVNAPDHPSHVYMSPEQLDKKEARSDIYSLGTVLFEMATGVNLLQARIALWRDRTSDGASWYVYEHVAAGSRSAAEGGEGERGEEIGEEREGEREKDRGGGMELKNRILGMPHGLLNVIFQAIKREPNLGYQNANDVLIALKKARGEFVDFTGIFGSPEPSGAPEHPIRVGRDLATTTTIRSGPDDETGSAWSDFDKETGSAGSDFEVIKIFYATDRQQTGNRQTRKFYANDRAPNGTLSFGVCEVSIPGSDRHRIGFLEKPSIYRLEFRQNPKKHVVLLSVQTIEEEHFFNMVKRRVERSARKEAFIFIHGYNVTFEDAARRTAQFACDLRFDGAPVLYSWPSRGKWWKYTADETNANWSVPHLELFLKNMAAISGACTIHLIAHSMGNRVLASALELLVAKQSISTGLFRHIVLTAPDIDKETFDHLAVAIAPAAERLTLYSNYKDRALLMSKLFHLYSRAGSTIVILKGMDTIDASKVDTSLTRHSYFGSNRTVLADLSSLLLEGKPPKKRFGMRERQTKKGPYYVFRP